MAGGWLVMAGDGHRGIVVGRGRPAWLVILPDGFYGCSVCMCVRHKRGQRFWQSLLSVLLFLLFSWGLLFMLRRCCNAGSTGGRRFMLRKLRRSTGGRIVYAAEAAAKPKKLSKHLITEVAKAEKGARADRAALLLVAQNEAAAGQVVDLMEGGIEIEFD